MSLENSLLKKAPSIGIYRSAKTPAIGFKERRLFCAVPYILTVPPKVGCLPARRPVRKEHKPEQKGRECVVCWKLTEWLLKGLGERLNSAQGPRSCSET